MSQLSLIEKPYAVFSACELHTRCAEGCDGQRYRYLLGYPTGLQHDRVALGAFANPSKATAFNTDPTVAKWIRYCRAWGFGRAWVVNARAWRETDPDLVPPDPLAIGPDNDRYIREAVQRAELIVCGWGKLGGSRGPAVLRIIREAGKVPLALKLNADGSPTHPLYLSEKLRPFPISEAGQAWAIAEGRA